MNDLSSHQKVAAASTVALFTTLGTLVCCALPALFVTLGAGAALAGLVSTAPWLVELSRHKVLVFGVAAALLVVAGVMLWRARYLPCPANAAQAKACSNLRRLSWWIYGIAVTTFATGAFFAFFASKILL
jgi:predicted small integral membrane protein